MSSTFDPHGIIPDDFPYESLEEAQADTQPSDAATSPRCPTCYSTECREKRDALRPQANRRPEDFKCLACGSHCDFRAPPLVESIAPNDLDDVAARREVFRTLCLTRREIGERAGCSPRLVSVVIHGEGASRDAEAAVIDVLREELKEGIV